MNKRLSFVMILSASALAWVGCDEQPADTDAGCGPGTGVICLDDGGRDGGPGSDSGMRDSGPPPGCSPSPTTGSAAGAACLRQTACTSDDCNTEIAVQFTTNTGGGYPVKMYPGSMCGDACNPNAATDPCGECATCTDHSYVGRVRLPALGVSADGTMITLVDGVCRANCEPDPATNGGCRTGYTCEIDGKVCLEACTSNDDCNVGVADGFLAPNPSGPWTCNTTTGRCALAGTAGAHAGDACTVDTDCMNDGQCLTGAAIPNGFCTRLSCNAPGFECDSGEVCSLVGLGGGSWCLPSCTVGADAEADRIGAAGHGMGCAAGNACIWDGQGNEPTGGCQPANYNDITTPNVGGACQTSADCYSPFGYGVCIFAGEENVDSGICAIQNCAQFMNSAGATVDGIMPGVETTTRVCDSSAGELCIDFSGGADVPQTYCILGCDSAAECAPGYACNDGLLTSGQGLCWPNCSADAQCHAGATCVDPEADAHCVPNGPDGVRGTADDPTCFCSDTMPRTDGGMPTDDAGTATPDAGPATADAGVDDAG